MSLKSFSYTGELVNNYCLYNTSVALCWERRPAEVAYYANKLLRAVFNVKDPDHIASDTVETCLLLPCIHAQFLIKKCLHEFVLFF